MTSGRSSSTSRPSANTNRPSGGRGTLMMVRSSTVLAHSRHRSACAGLRWPEGHVTAWTRVASATASAAASSARRWWNACKFTVAPWSRWVACGEDGTGGGGGAGAGGTKGSSGAGGGAASVPGGAGGKGRGAAGVGGASSAGAGIRGSDGESFVPAGLLGRGTYMVMSGKCRSGFSSQSGVGATPKPPKSGTPAMRPAGRGGRSEPAGSSAAGSGARGTDEAVGTGIDGAGATGAATGATTSSATGAGTTGSGSNETDAGRSASGSGGATGASATTGSGPSGVNEPSSRPAGAGPSARWKGDPAARPTSSIDHCAASATTTSAHVFSSVPSMRWTPPSAEVSRTTTGPRARARQRVPSATTIPNGGRSASCRSSPSNNVANTASALAEVARRSPKRRANGRSACWSTSREAAGPTMAHAGPGVADTDRIGPGGPDGADGVLTRPSVARSPHPSYRTADWCRRRADRRSPRQGRTPGRDRRR